MMSFPQAKRVGNPSEQSISDNPERHVNVLLLMNHLVTTNKSKTSTRYPSQTKAFFEAKKLKDRYIKH
jgi:hypothetical protein